MKQLNNTNKFGMVINRQKGLTLIEIMISIALLSLVVAGMSQFFITLKENTNQQDMQLELNENLRIAMTRITDDLRNADFLVPRKDLQFWIDWTDITYTDNPFLVQDAIATNSDTLYIAASTDGPQAFLTAASAAGATSVNVNTTAPFNITSKSLININQKYFAKITNVGAGTLTFDTRPAKAGAADLATLDGTLRPHLSTAPIFVVEVKKYSVDQTNNILQLVNYGSNGDAIQDLVEGISNMKIEEVTAGNEKHLRITLTATSDEVDQDSGALLVRSMTSEVVTLN